MQLSDATRKRIKNLMNQNNIKKPYDLTRKAGISLPTFSDFMKGDTKNLRSDTVLHICEAFNITLAEFYSDPLFEDVMAE
ncbi:putative uncharacterized protein [Clostridium sp. CAG:343]|nr:putative uncharacterized protein [Clostridium sp. CAG:343]HCF34993.1 XRE family transcriptional regulator [Clostridiales bacterium]